MWPFGRKIRFRRDSEASTTLSKQRRDMFSASPVYLSPGSGGHVPGSRREEALDKREKTFHKVRTSVVTFTRGLASVVVFVKGT